MKANRIEFKGAVNFRDIGGYSNKLGNTIKKGHIYRSDSLAKLTDDDLEIIANLNLKTIIDFRTDEEVTNSPDRLPVNHKINYVRLPIKAGEFDFSTAMALLEKDEVWPVGDFMLKNYESYLTDFADTWKTLFDLIADADNLPLMFHCTAGKDRTGAGSALILKHLGVDDDIIIEDHQASNHFIAPIVNDIKQKLKEKDEKYSKLEPFFNAPKNAIERFIRLLNHDFGSVERYFSKKAPVSAHDLKAVRNNLLQT